MKVVIIDDESHARNVLATLITEECAHIVTQLFQAEDLQSGVAIIKEEQPELVLLDIKMPRESGLNILSHFKNESVNFKIVYTTAYDQYALEALKTSALDYLLKPIDSEELKTVIHKVNRLSQKESVADNMANLKRSFHQLALNKIALELPGGVKFISYSDILYFEADGVYTKIYLQDGSVLLITKVLKHFADQLADNLMFYKTHRAYIINLKFMDEVIKKDRCHIIMQNKKTIPVSRDRRVEFLSMIQRMF